MCPTHMSDHRAFTENACNYSKNIYIYSDVVHLENQTRRPAAILLKLHLDSPITGFFDVPTTFLFCLV